MFSKVRNVKDRQLIKNKAPDTLLTWPLHTSSGDDHSVVFVLLYLTDSCSVTNLSFFEQVQCGDANKGASVARRQS